MKSGGAQGRRRAPPNSRLPQGRRRGGVEWGAVLGGEDKDRSRLACAPAKGGGRGRRTHSVAGFPANSVWRHPREEEGAATVTPTPREEGEGPRYLAARPREEEGASPRRKGVQGRRKDSPTAFCCRIIRPCSFGGGHPREGGGQAAACCEAPGGRNWAYASLSFGGIPVGRRMGMPPCIRTPGRRRGAGILTFVTCQRRKRRRGQCG